MGGNNNSKRIERKAKKIKSRVWKMEAKSEKMEEIEEVFGKMALKMGAMYLVSNKKLGGDR